MELNARPTLGEMIAAGHRLLGAAPTGSTVTAAPGDVVEAAVAVPSPREHAGHTADEIALLVGLAPWTVAEHLRNGTLHGHVRAGRWSVHDGVADAFREGIGPAGQRRVCGCRPLRVVEGTGAAGAGDTRRRRSRRVLQPL